MIDDDFRKVCASCKSVKDVCRKTSLKKSEVYRRIKTMGVCLGEFKRKKISALVDKKMLDAFSMAWQAGRSLKSIAISLHRKRWEVEKAFRLIAQGVASGRGLPLPVTIEDVRNIAKVYHNENKGEQDALFTLDSSNSPVRL